MKILAGIITYNPDLERLKENISAVYDQVDKIIIIDNHSQNKSGIITIIREYSNIDVEYNARNNGIACALNQIMHYAHRYEYDWVLTLDQDSVCEKELLHNYSKYLHIENVGMFTCNIKDRNYEFRNEYLEGGAIGEVTYCITSGALVNVGAFLMTRGFDEKMFIDKVDFDFCLSLKEKGFKIIKINTVGLLQEVGKGHQVHFFNKNIVLYNHSPLRRYYMTRNGIYLARKHKSKSLFRAICREFYDILIVLIFENQKWDKFSKSCKGLYDGFHMEISET